MKIQLPNGKKVVIDEWIPLDEKKVKVQELVEEFSFEIENNWNSQSVKFFLSNLADYLVWHKEPEDKGKKDLDVISKRKVREMNGKEKSKLVLFSYLNKPNRTTLFGEVEDNE